MTAIYSLDHRRLVCMRHTGRKHVRVELLVDNDYRVNDFVSKEIENIGLILVE